jgi:hypothetical protein
MRDSFRRVASLVPTLASLVALAIAGGAGFRGW